MCYLRLWTATTELLVISATNGDFVKSPYVKFPYLIVREVPRVFVVINVNLCNIQHYLNCTNLAYGLAAA